jgi:hypothetical protein
LYRAESVLKIQLKIPKVTGNEVVWEFTYPIQWSKVKLSQEVAKSLGNDQFKTSTGWLDSFKKRHNIVWNGVCGESKDVDQSVLSEYKPKLTELISPYEPENIYNADETGLFFWALPTKLLMVKGQMCTGGRMSKERLKVLLCGIWWEKWKRLS